MGHCMVLVIISAKRRKQNDGFLMLSGVIQSSDK
jgi:hypothetical protein